MQDLNDLWFFAQVVEHKGFTAAARALRVPKSKLSRRVAQLEERLGVRLIQRSTRHFAVTELGLAYYRHCAALAGEASAAQDFIDAALSEAQGLIRVSCSVPLLQSRVGAMVSRFLAAHPKVRVEVVAVNRPVDLIEEGIDVALRVRPPPLVDSDLIMRMLAHDHQHLVASPALLARVGRPVQPGELARFESADMARASGHVWRLTGPDGREAVLHHHPRLVTDDMVTLRRAALDGLAVVQLPRFVIGDDLASGTLVPVLPGWEPASWVVHAAFLSRRGLIPAVRMFIDFLVDEFARP